MDNKPSNEKATGGSRNVVFTEDDEDFMDKKGNE